MGGNVPLSVVYPGESVMIRSNKFADVGVKNVGSIISWKRLNDVTRSYNFSFNSLVWWPSSHV